MDALLIRVEPGDAGARLDRFLSARLPEHSRSQIQKWIREGHVTLNARSCRPSTVLEAGAEIRVQVPEAAPQRLQPIDLPLHFVFEDAHVAVIDKPAGLQVHPGAGAPRPTLVQALLGRDPDWPPPGPPSRPGIVHRLDRDTSGLLVVARSALAYQSLGEQIRSRQVRRRYLALVWGDPREDAGTIDDPLGRHPRFRTRVAVVGRGRRAVTRWRVLRRFEHLTLLEVTLETGRTHQIRVHLAHHGNPIFGDPTYGDDRARIEHLHPQERPLLHWMRRHLKRQALHAYHLSFRHPARPASLRFEAPPPPDMEQVLVRMTEEGLHGDPPDGGEQS